MSTDLFHKSAGLYKRFLVDPVKIKTCEICRMMSNLYVLIPLIFSIEFMISITVDFQNDVWKMNKQ